MRSSLVVAASVVIMLIGLVGTAVILFDEDRVKGLVISQVERNTGRKVEILGSMNLRLFPGLQLYAEEIVLRDRLDPSQPAFLSADRLQVQLRLLPLVRGRAVADEVRLSGTRLNLQVDSDGLARPGTQADEDDGLTELGFSTGNIILDDLSVEIHDEAADYTQSFTIEQAHLSGFAFDRPVAFRFDGNVGEPHLFDHLDVTGRLTSRASGQFLLDDMRLAGSLDQGRYWLEVYGDVTFQAGSASAFTLTGGQLVLNEYQLELDLAYRALERPFLSAVIGGQLLEVDTIELLDQVTMLPHESSRSATLAAIAGLDFDVQLDLAQVGLFGLVLQDLSAQVSGNQGRLSVNHFRMAVPGGLASGQAVLDLGFSSPRWQLQADVEMAEAERLFDIWWPGSALSGAGRLGLSLESVGRDGYGAVDLPWRGQGHLALWDGRWDLLGFLGDAAGAEPSGNGSFASLEAVWRFGSGHLQWQPLEMVGAGWVAHGEIEVSGRRGDLLGNLQLRDEQGAVHSVELGGRLAQPELLAPPTGSTAFQ